MWPNRARYVAPDDECIAQGSEFFSQIDRWGDSHSGAVHDKQGNIRWRYGYGSRNDASRRSLRNPFNKPDFVIRDPDGRNEVAIRRASFVPPVFNIMEAGKVIGSVRMRSIFRNSHTIDIDGISSWNFRMPLFTVYFFGQSRAGVEIWVEMGSQTDWAILIKNGVKEWPLLAVLAFIHTERWNYS